MKLPSHYCATVDRHYNRKCRDNRPLIFCVLCRLYNSRDGAKETFQFALTRWPGGQNCKSPHSCFTLFCFVNDSEVLFSSRAGNLCERRCTFRERGKFPGMRACFCLWNDSVACKWESVQVGKRVVTQRWPLHSCVFSESGLENVCLNWRLLSLRSLCSTSPNTGELTKERLKLKQGMSVFHPEMEGKNATEDVMLAKCPLSIFNLIDFIILTYPAECLLIFHASPRNFPLDAPVSATASQSRCTVLLLKGEHAELSQWDPSPGLSNWTATWPTCGFNCTTHLISRTVPLSSMHEQMPPPFLISFAPHWKARLSTGLHRAVAPQQRELSSKANRGNAGACATYSSLLGQTSEQTLMWFAYLTNRTSTHCESRTWCRTTWRWGSSSSLNESKDRKFEKVWKRVAWF